MKNKLFFGASVLLCVLLAAWAYRTYAVRNLSYTFYLETAPADPRALLSGDYMALSYAFERAAERKDAVLCAVQKSGADASVTGAVLELNVAGEECITVPYKKRRYRVPHQFYFQEGTGHKYTNARYAVVRRVGKNALSIIGLADENLHLIK